MAFKKAANPDVSPEQQATEANAELARLQALLAQAEKNPDVLLPPPFRATGPGGKPSVNAEMKEALEAATGELKEWKAKLDTFRTEVANWEGRQNARRAERDKLFQVVAAMKARGVEREEPAGTATASTASRKLARERQRQRRVEVAGRGPPAPGDRVSDRPRVEARGRARAGHAGLSRAGEGRREDTGAHAVALHGPRRTAGAHPQGKGRRSRRTSRGGRRIRWSGSVPVAWRSCWTSRRRSSGSSRSWPPRRRRRWKSSGAWPTTPRPTSRGSRSCSTTDGSAASTPSGSTTTSAGSDPSATGCSATRWPSPSCGSSITRTR